jgi:glutathione S-transferase
VLFAPILKFGDPTFNEAFTYKVVKAALRNFEKIYLRELNFLGEEKPNIADLIAFHDITMLEVLDFDYVPFPKIQKWVARMRQLPYIQKANEQFEASKENLKMLRQKPSPKL